MEEETAGPTMTERHEKHQRMLDRHAAAKVERREDHKHPGRKKKFPPGSLK